MPRNNKDWSAEEEKRLTELLATNKSMAFVAKELGRTEAAVSSRTSTIKHRAKKQSAASPAHTKTQR